MPDAFFNTPPDDKKTNELPVTTPSAPDAIHPARRESTLGGKLVALAGVVVSCAYLANLGSGIFLEIPDILPGVGNLDEVIFTSILIASLAKLGIPLLPNLTGRSPRNSGD